MDEITKDERVLVIVANLVIEDSAAGDYKSLYQWLDRYAVLVTNMLMRPVYRQVVSLTGPNVKRNTMVDCLIDLVADPQTKAIDTILVMHGSPGYLYFDDGPITTAKLGDQIQTADLGHKLRLLYSTACYGATHVDDFIRAGFRTACGAKKVCANGPYELPTQLLNWGSNKTYKSTVKAGNNPVFLIIHDNAAKLLGFDDVDSEKVIAGKVTTRITSDAL